MSKKSDLPEQEEKQQGLKRRIDTPESREFWEYVDKAAAEVDSWDEDRKRAAFNLVSPGLYERLKEQGKL